jgi:hypothetical protein
MSVQLAMHALAAVEAALLKRAQSAHAAAETSLTAVGLTHEKQRSLYDCFKAEADAYLMAVKDVREQMAQVSFLVVPMSATPVPVRPEEFNPKPREEQR